MTASSDTGEASSSTRSSILGLLGAWPVVVGLSALAVPTALNLADQEWTRDSGAHGPIVISIGGWLLWRQTSLLRGLPKPGSWLVALVVLGVALSLYVFGRAYDFLTLQAAGLYGAVVVALYTHLGFGVIRKLWFPLFFLAFGIPAPHVLLDGLTAPLKEFVSFVATHALAGAGLPVARQGVTIFVGQYQLLVEDACSGMNSVVGLTAIGLLYVYLVRGASIGYSIFLTCLTVPVAVAANVVRVALLVVITYFLGDEVGQSFIHFVAGILLFSTALLLVFVLDKGIQYLISRLRGRAP
jgi:exosortase